MPIQIEVWTEEETIQLLLAGTSISRFGDGEFKMLRGGGIKSQVADPSLTDRLKQIMRNDEKYLVGIPRLDERSPKYEYWKHFMAAHESFLNINKPYGSSVITRPDSAPWIDNDDYWDKIMSLWRGKHAVLIWGGSRKSLTPSMLSGAKKLDVIECPSHNAWSERSTLLAQLDALPKKPEVAVIVLGPTATGIVPDIVDRGIQALDLGHIGACMRHVPREKKRFKTAHGFFWPYGGEAYGKRYIERAHDLDYAVKHCPKRRSAIQAGGHVGVWAKYLAGSFMQVYTIEPEHMNFLALCRNASEKHIYRIQAVLGDRHERVNLVIHPENIGGHHVKGEGLIPQLRIDDLGVTDCDLIVLDIEGSELAAIRGGEETIKACKPVLHLEMRGHIEKYNRGSTEELEQLLRDWGYRRRQEISKDYIYIHGP